MLIVGHTQHTISLMTTCWLKSRLKATNFVGLNVIVVDGLFIPSQGIMQQLNLTFDDHEECDEFYVLVSWEANRVL